MRASPDNITACLFGYLKVAVRRIKPVFHASIAGRSEHLEIIAGLIVMSEQHTPFNQVTRYSKDFSSNVSKVYFMYLLRLVKVRPRKLMRRQALHDVSGRMHIWLEDCLITISKSRALYLQGNPASGFEVSESSTFHQLL